MRRGYVVAGTIVVLLAVGVGWLLSHRPSTTEEPVWNDLATTVSSDGRAVTLTYTGGDCGHEHPMLHVREGADVVEASVVVRTTNLPRACGASGIARQIVAHLKAPLGDRRLVHGECHYPHFTGPLGCERRARSHDAVSRFTLPMGAQYRTVRAVRGGSADRVLAVHTRTGRSAS